MVAAVLAIVYRYVCVWENNRRDKLGAEAFDHAYEDDLTDMKVSTIFPLISRTILTVVAESTIQIPALVGLKNFERVDVVIQAPGDRIKKLLMYFAFIPVQRFSSDRSLASAL